MRIPDTVDFGPPGWLASADEELKGAASRAIDHREALLKRRMFGIGLATFSVAATMMTPASAITPNHVLGGRWSTAGVGYTCSVRVGDYNGWCNNVMRPGASSWAGTGFSFNFLTNGQHRVLSIQDSYQDSNWYGATTHSPSSTSGTYSFSYAYISHYETTNPAGLHGRTYGSPASTADKACTMSHEFGHVLGLNHHSSTPNTVMDVAHNARCGHAGVSSPSGHDVADVDYLY